MNIRNFPFLFGQTLFRVTQSRSFTKIKLTNIPNPFQELNITICGANSRIGRLSAMLFKKKNIFKNIILWDEHHDMKELVISDLSNITTSTNFRTYHGRKGLVDAVSDSRIIYICDNIQTVPGLTPLDLFKSNANTVRQVVLYTSEFNPTAIIVIATPPVTSLVPMAYEEMLKNDCDAEKQIFGVAHNFLGTANAIAKIFCPSDKFDHKHYVIGGCDKDTCIPVFSNSSSGRILSIPDFSFKAKGKKIKGAKDVVKYFQNAEENVLKTKVKEASIEGCCLSLAAGGYQFIANLAKALSGEQNITDYAFVKQKNPINYNQRYLTCQVNLNEEGLKSCVIPNLSDAENDNLKAIESVLNKYIFAGEVYITGREQVPEHRRKIIKPQEEPTPEPIHEPEPKEDVFCNPRPKPKSIHLKSE